MKIFKHLFLFFAFVFNANLATAWEDMSSTDKEAIQKILKKATSEELKIDIKDFLLAPRFMKKGNDWIFISLKLQDTKGKLFEYLEEHDLYEDQHMGMISNEIYALLRKNNGNWELIDIAFHPTDVAWEHWAEKYHAPKHLFYITCLLPEYEGCYRLERIITPWRGTWHPPIHHNERSIGSQEPPFIIQDKKIMWKRCGTEARKVKVSFIEFHGRSSGIFLEIEGEPCINEEKGHAISYIHVERAPTEKEHGNRWLCTARISFYDNPFDATGREKNKHLDRKIYTKPGCSVSHLSEYFTGAAAKLLNIKKAELQLGYSHLDAVGDWMFITAGVRIDGETKITVHGNGATHIIYALLKRNGTTWDLVEIDAGKEENEALFPRWIQTHHIPQDGKKTYHRCPDACPY